jgi:hypothetical protein
MTIFIISPGQSAYQALRPDSDLSNQTAYQNITQGPLLIQKFEKSTKTQKNLNI